MEQKEKSLAKPIIITLCIFLLIGVVLFIVIFTHFRSQIEYDSSTGTYLINKGDYVVSGIRVSSDEAGQYTVTGTVTNNTDNDCKKISLIMQFVDSDGKGITTESASVANLKAGDSAALNYSFSNSETIYSYTILSATISK